MKYDFYQELQKLQRRFGRLGAPNASSGQFCKELLEQLLVEANRRRNWEEDIQRQIDNLQPEQ